MPLTPKGANGCQLLVFTWKAPTPMNKAITAIFINTIISLTFLLSLVPKDITKTINKIDIIAGRFTIPPSLGIAVNVFGNFIPRISKRLKR